MVLDQNFIGLILLNSSTFFMITLGVGQNRILRLTGDRETSKVWACVVLEQYVTKLYRRLSSYAYSLDLYEPPLTSSTKVIFKLSIIL